MLKLITGETILSSIRMGWFSIYLNRPLKVYYISDDEGMELMRLLSWTPYSSGPKLKILKRSLICSPVKIEGEVKDCYYRTLETYDYEDRFKGQTIEERKQTIQAVRELLSNGSVLIN